MDDLQALERRVASEVVGEIGPSEPVDDLAIFNTMVAVTHSPKWKFQSMFSATKFVIAGVIVALFGGFLLTGVLTQRNEPLPVGASASAGVRSDLLSGLDLEVEEVGPRLIRVLGDGERQTRRSIIDVAIAPNGDVWVMRHNGTVYRLGEPGNAFQDRDQSFLLRNDDTLWVASRRLEGEDWVKDEADLCVANDSFPYGIVAPDGTCWFGPHHSSGSFHPTDESGRWLDTARADGYKVERGDISIAEDGTLWARLGTSFNGLAAYDGTTWTAVEFDGVIDARQFSGLGVGSDGTGLSGQGIGPDGTVWTALLGEDGLVVVSWDGETWATYERGRGELGPRRSLSGDHPIVRFLPDGSPWFFGVAEIDGEALRPIDVLASLGDETPTVKALANAADGSTWVVVDQPGVTDGGLYVITAEAVTATE